MRNLWQTLEKLTILCKSCPKSVACSAELVLLNKQQISGGGACLHCYRDHSHLVTILPECKLTDKLVCWQIITKNKTVVHKMADKGLSRDWRTLYVGRSSTIVRKNVRQTIAKTFTYWRQQLLNANRYLSQLNFFRIPVHRTHNCTKQRHAHKIAQYWIWRAGNCACALRNCALRSRRDHLLFQHSAE